METKGKFLISKDGKHLFYCPACNDFHGIYVNTDKYSWNFDGNYDKPTILPSIKVSHEGRDSYVCHSFIRNGKIEYLSDCSHNMAGKTVDMTTDEFDTISEA
jgi:transposase-like protein